MTAISAISTDGTVKVEWVDLGEGLCGDYDPDDPDDVSLLRFDAYVTTETGEKYPDLFTEDTYGDEGWVTPADSSYCTGVLADTDNDTLRSLAQYMANELASEVGSGGFRRRAEDLSWISLDLTA